ncbi:MAG: hypothetical protein LUI13_13810 [Lachnospiraceae bacterium]|nr:hypothetical protein [Lachnospiraceae bacterium]
MNRICPASVDESYVLLRWMDKDWRKGRDMDEMETDKDVIETAATWPCTPRRYG